jgi:hypothetical protein
MGQAAPNNIARRSASSWQSMKLELFLRMDTELQKLALHEVLWLLRQSAWLQANF